MTRCIEPGEIAKHNYREVQYSHIDVGPVDSLVLTADPWSYLYAHLMQKISKSRADNKANYKRAHYYANLAESFYNAGKGTVLPAQGTLIYYGMLNLVKCLLAANGVELETVIEHHGLNLPQRKSQTVQVQKQSSNSVNIFAEFAKYFGTPVLSSEPLTISEIASHIPELHETCYQLGILTNKRYFLPIEIDFLVNKSHNQLFTEVRYQKGHEAQIATDKFMDGKRESYFKHGYPRDGWEVFRCKNQKPVNKKNWERIYRNVCLEYREFKFSSILTRTGYRYYCDLTSGNYHHLYYTYLLMFYLGTAARYRPQEIEKVLSGMSRSMLTEAIALCPEQFLYQLVSEITKKRCVIPFSKLS